MRWSYARGDPGVQTTAVHESSVGTEQDLWPLTIALSVCQVQPPLKTSVPRAQAEKVRGGSTLSQSLIKI